MNIHSELLWNWYLVNDYNEVLNLPFTASRKRRRKRSSHQRPAWFYYQLCRQLFKYWGIVLPHICISLLCKRVIPEMTVRGNKYILAEAQCTMIPTEKIVLSYIQCYLLGFSKACLYWNRKGHFFLNSQNNNHFKPET